MLLFLLFSGDDWFVRFVSCYLRGFVGFYVYLVMIYVFGLLAWFVL